VRKTAVRLAENKILTMDSNPIPALKASNHGGKEKLARRI